MLVKFKKHQFIDLAKQKRKVTWSEIEDYFGSDITESKDFDYLLYKFDEEGIKVINNSFDKSLSSEKNTETKKKIVVKIKKSPEQIKLENETIKLNQLLSYAKSNGNKLSCKDIQSIMTLERIIIEDEKFNKTIKVLQEHNIEFVDANYDNDGLIKINIIVDESVFESYVNFENFRLINLRKQFGQQNSYETEKFNKTFKEYLVKAYLEMGYSKLSICEIYEISDEALNDWIFVYKNNYDPILPIKDGKFTFYPGNLKQRGLSLYTDQKMTYEEIALKLHVYPSTVKRWVSRKPVSKQPSNNHENSFKEPYKNIKQILEERELREDLYKEFGHALQDDDYN